MRKQKVLLLLAAGWLVVGFSQQPGEAAIPLDEKGSVKLYWDFRLRLETDQDSRKADGTERADRTRARIRARAGLKYEPTPYLTFGARTRTGAAGSQQSPHITVKDFDDNSTGDQDILVDKWFVKLTGERPWLWLGKNSLPFWKQNEMFWDDDVTPAGVGIGYKASRDEAKYSINAGYFELPDGARDHNGNLAALQLAYSKKLSDVGLSAAGGILFFDGEPGAEHLRNGNGARDYATLVGSLEIKRPVGGKTLAFGVDLMHNAENYSPTDPDSFTATNHDERDGYVLSGRWGELKEKGDWLAAYYYARIETLAVNASYAQDDWVRWGSATQTDSSDLKGHEIRLGYCLSPDAHLIARLYLVEAITSEQDGNRFRLDFNYKF